MKCSQGKRGDLISASKSVTLTTREIKLEVVRTEMRTALRSGLDPGVAKERDSGSWASFECMCVGLCTRCFLHLRHYHPAV